MLIILVSLFVFLISLLIVLFFIKKRIPILVALPTKNHEHDFEEEFSHFLQKHLTFVKLKLFDFYHVFSISALKFFTKSLYHFKINALRADNLTSHWIKDLKNQVAKKVEMKNNGNGKIEEIKFDVVQDGIPAKVFNEIPNGKIQDKRVSLNNNIAVKFNKSDFFSSLKNDPDHPQLQEKIQNLKDEMKNGDDKNVPA